MRFGMVHAATLACSMMRKALPDARVWRGAYTIMRHAASHGVVHRCCVLHRVHGRAQLMACDGVTACSKPAARWSTMATWCLVEVLMTVTRTINSSPEAQYSTWCRGAIPATICSPEETACVWWCRQRKLNCCGQERHQL